MGGHPDDFARLVALACHDLRTPLATVNGFARTLTRLGASGDKTARYLELMAAAGDQMAALLEDLSTVARIESGRWEPALREEDSLTLARAGAASVLEGEVEVAGEGTLVLVEPDAAARAVHHFARGAIRHGGVAALRIDVAGGELRLGPLTPEVTAVVLGDDLRDLGGPVGCRIVAALGGSVAAEDGTLVVRLPPVGG